MGTFLSVVNSSSLIIAIPTIIAELRISFFLAIWVIVAYSLALTVLTPILGKYSDIVGRKKLYSLGYLVFFAGSVISSVATSGDILLSGRIIQGIGGAFLFSNSLAIITDTFKSVELRGAMGVNAAILAIGTSIGPLLGGILTAFTWRAIFIFNMPIALVGYVLANRYIREMSHGRNGEIDGRGAIFLSMAIVTGIVFLTIIPGIDLVSAVPLLLLAGFIVFFFLFWNQERISPRPILNPGILRNHTIAVSTLALVMASISRFSVIFLYTLFYQGPLRFSALTAGILLIPLAGSMGALSYLSGHLKAKYSDTFLENLGLALTGIGSFAAAILIIMRQPYLLFTIPMMVIGAGNGLFYTPNSAVIMLSAPAQIRGETAGVRTLMVNLGSVMGLTIVFLIITAMIPPGIVDAIFLGVGQAIPGSYNSLFYTASAIVLLISGIISFIPMPLIFGHRPRKE